MQNAAGAGGERTAKGNSEGRRCGEGKGEVAGPKIAERLKIGRGEGGRDTAKILAKKKEKKGMAARPGIAGTTQFDQEAVRGGGQKGEAENVLGGKPEISEWPLENGAFCAFGVIPPAGGTLPATPPQLRTTGPGWPAV